MEIIKQTYHSGLRSLSVLSKDSQTVTVMFLVGVGSRYEAANEKGLAHFVEHTLFKGTAKRSTSKEIGMEIESLGGSSNAFTSYDYTGYYIKAPAINFRNTFEILADMFTNSQFKEEDIDKERGVIVEEIRMYDDRPNAKVMQQWLANFFRGNSLGTDITGSLDSVMSIKREQFFEFIKKHYYAENILLVIAGNVEQSEVESCVNDYCGGIESRGERPASTFDSFSFEKTDERQRSLLLNKDVEQAHIVLGGLGVSRDDPNRFALQVANTILGAGFGSKLFQVIRDELGLAYYVYSRLSSYAETGLFQIGIGADMKKAELAIQAAKEQVLDVANGKFSEAEFNRAKNYLLGNLVTDMETSEDVAGFYGMQEILQKEKLSIEDVKNRIMAVSVHDIRESCQNVFTDENLYLAMISRN